MWTCPKCNRDFKNKNQWHSCQVGSVEDILKKKSKEKIELFKLIHTKVMSFGEMKIDALKTTIQYRAGACFLALSFKKDFVNLEFSLPHKYNNPPIYYTSKISSKRYFHKASIYDQDDFDKKFVEIIKSAYLEIKNESY